MKVRNILSLRCSFKSNSNFSGHMRLLSTFSSNRIIDMVEFMLTMPGIHDTKTPDGTTALSMAIATGDTNMAETLLGFYSQQKITFSNDPKSPQEKAFVRDVTFVKNALREMDHDSPMAHVLIKVLCNSLPEGTLKTEDKDAVKELQSSE